LQSSLCSFFDLHHAQAGAGSLERPFSAERLFLRARLMPLNVARAKPSHDFLRIFIWWEDRIENVANFAIGNDHC
jgi:hypothetical protein